MASALIPASWAGGAGKSADLLHFRLRDQPVHFQRPAPVCFLNPVGIQVYGQLDCGVPQLLLYVCQAGSCHNHPGRVGVPNGVDIPILKAQARQQWPPDPVSKVIRPNHAPLRAGKHPFRSWVPTQRRFCLLKGQMVFQGVHQVPRQINLSRFPSLGGIFQMASSKIPANHGVSGMEVQVFTLQGHRFPFTESGSEQQQQEGQ